MRRITVLLIFACASSAALAETGILGTLTDPQGKPVAGAAIRLFHRGDALVTVSTDDTGHFGFPGIAPGDYRITAAAPGFTVISKDLVLAPDHPATADLQLSGLQSELQSVTVAATSREPSIDLRNSEVFSRTLFTRDDQVLQQLNAGIDAGQHEGGGKSLEIRRFGFNLDHGGVNGGLKVLVDDVQQNQGTQGHGQGYLGALKALSPELIQDVTIINGPFSAEYGDFSGLGVVHIRQRESLPDEITLRLQGGNFDTGRGFLAFSPDVQKVDAYVAYEGSYTNGPFQSLGRYRRDNLNANYTTRLGENEKMGFRVLF